MKLQNIAVAAIAVSALPASAGLITTELNLDFNLNANTTIDVNNDGVNDFSFYQYEYSYDRVQAAYSSNTYNRTAYRDTYDRAYLSLSGLNGFSFSSNLVLERELISDDLAFVTSAMLVDNSDRYRGAYSYQQRNYSCGRRSCSYGSWRDWVSVDVYDHEFLNGSFAGHLSGGDYTGYIGFKSDKEQFGWLNVTLNDRGQGSINSMTMQTVNNTPLESGARQQQNAVSVSEPTTLGLMLLGLGVTVRRKKKVQ